MKDLRNVTVAVKRNLNATEGECGAIVLKAEKVTEKNALRLMDPKDAAKSLMSNVTFDYTEVFKKKSGSILRMGAMAVVAFLAVYFC